jgi:hypothetical protein
MKKTPLFKNFRVNIRGKRWTVLRKAPPGAKTALGLCVKADQTIYIRPGAEMPGTIIHEVLHAALWDLDEDAVSETEAAIMECLKKCNILVEEKK